MNTDVRNGAHHLFDPTPLSDQGFWCSVHSVHTTDDDGPRGR